MRPIPSRVRAAAALTAAGALLLAGCSADAGTESAESSASGGTLTWGVASEPTCFDPHFSDVLADRAIIRNYVDSLVYQEEDGTFTPWLADSWTVSEDGTEYVFEIASDVTFTDGEALDADAVKQNLDVVGDPANGSSYSTLLSSVSEIAADGQTLTITLSAPDSSLLASLSSVTLGIVSPAGLEAGNENCTPGETLAGTGAFEISEYSRGEQITLVRNDDYNSAPDSLDHGGAAHLDTVVYRFLTEDSVRVGALASGEVDAILGIPALDVPSLSDSSDISYEAGPYSLSTFGFTINANTEPWDDVALRQAFRDGLRLDDIVESIYQGVTPRAWSWVGTDSPEYDASLEGAWGDRVDEANAAFDEAGWSERDADGYRVKDGERLTLAVTYDADSIRDQRDKLVEAIQSQVGSDLGVYLDFTTPTWAELAEDIAAGDWSVYPGSYGKVDYANSVIGSWGGYFYGTGEWKPAEAIDLAERAIATADPDEYAELLDEIQQYLVIDEAIFIPLVESNFQVAYRNGVDGIRFDNSAGIPDSNYTVSNG